MLATGHDTGGFEWSVISWHGKILLIFLALCIIMPFAFLIEEIIKDAIKVRKLRKQKKRLEETRRLTDQ